MPEHTAPLAGLRLDAIEQLKVSFGGRYRLLHVRTLVLYDDDFFATWEDLGTGAVVAFGPHGMREALMTLAMQAPFVGPATTGDALCLDALTSGFLTADGVRTPVAWQALVRQVGGVWRAHVRDLACVCRAPLVVRAGDLPAVHRAYASRRATPCRHSPYPVPPRAAAAPRSFGPDPPAASSR